MRTRIRCKTYDLSVSIFQPISFDWQKWVGQLDMTLHLTSNCQIIPYPVSTCALFPVSRVSCGPEARQCSPRVQAVSSVRWHRYQGPGSRDQLRHPEPGSLIQPRLALIIDRSGEGWSLHYYFTNDLVQIISSIKGDYRELSSLAKFSKC